MKNLTEKHKSTSNNNQEFLNSLDKKINEIKEKNKIWSIEFNKLVEILNKAKTLENTDINEAINLYESIKKYKLWKL